VELNLYVGSIMDTKTITIKRITVPNQGTLSVITTPVNGEVLVNSVSKGNAPITISLAPESYVVSFGEVSKYISPSPVTVNIASGLTTTVTGTYIYNPAPPPTPPLILDLLLAYAPYIALASAGVLALALIVRSK